MKIKSLDLEEVYIPRDLDSEAAVLGSILTINAFPEVSEVLCEDHFDSMYKRIWRACKKTFEAHGSTTTNVVIDELKRAEDYQSGDLSTAIAVTGKAAIYKGKSFNTFIRNVKLNHSRRKAMENIHSAFTAIKVSDDPATEIIRASQGLEGMAIRRQSGSISEWMEETDYMENLSQTQKKPMFSGVQKLDMIMGGFHKGELSFIAARPGVGKTTLALVFSAFMESNGFAPAFVSAEMSVQALLDRMLAMESGRPVRKYRSGQYSLTANQEASKGISEGMGRMYDKKMLFIKAHGKGPADIRSALMHEKAKGKSIDIVFVDYIQLLRPDRDRNNRNDEMGEITSGLMVIADEFDCHVCCLSQLSRDGAEKEPQLHHLRDSGTLEQDANQVIMIWKTEDQPPGELTEINIKIAKNRDGMVGKCTALVDFATYTVKE